MHRIFARRPAPRLRRLLALENVGLSGYTKHNIGLNKSYIAGQRRTRPRLAQAALKSLILDPTPR